MGHVLYKNLDIKESFLRSFFKFNNNIINKKFLESLLLSLIDQDFDSLYEYNKNCEKYGYITSGYSNIKNYKQNGGGETQNDSNNNNDSNDSFDSFDSIIKTCNDIKLIIKDLSDSIIKVQPIYKSVETFDSTIRKNILASYPGYQQTEFIDEYYSTITKQCEEIL